MSANFALGSFGSGSAGVFRRQVRWTQWARWLALVLRSGVGPIAAMRGGQSADDDLTGSGGSGVSNLTTVEVSLTMTRLVRELIKYSPLMWLSGLFSGIAIETEESSWMHWLGIPLGLLFLVLWGIAILATSKLLEREMTTANNEQDNA